MQEQILLNTEGVIWKTYLDQTTDTLLIESRYEGEKSSAFSALSLNTKELLWQEFQLEADLWTGVACFKHGKLGIHIYDESKSYPYPKDLVVLNVENGAFAWSKEAVQLLDFTDDIAYVQELHNDQAQIHLSIQTGEALENHVWKKEKKFKNKLQNPLEYVQENEHFKTFEKFLEKKFQHQPFKSIEYLETTHYLILSYYVKSGKEWLQYLLLLNRTGETLYHECIGQSAKGVGLDTFMLYENLLLFTKRQNQLCLIELKKR